MVNSILHCNVILVKNKASVAAAIEKWFQEKLLKWIYGMDNNKLLTRSFWSTPGVLSRMVNCPGLLTDIVHVKFFQLRTIKSVTRKHTLSWEKKMTALSYTSTDHILLLRLEDGVTLIQQSKCRNTLARGEWNFILVVILQVTELRIIKFKYGLKCKGQYK